MGRVVKKCAEHKRLCANRIARSMGRSEEIYVSTRKNKKYVVNVRGKDIHFGDSRYEDYLDHRDDERRKRYLARATRIRNKRGQLTYRDPSSANFWAVHILW